MEIRQVRNLFDAATYVSEQKKKQDNIRDEIVRIGDRLFQDIKKGIIESGAKVGTQSEDYIAIKRADGKYVGVTREPDGSLRIAIDGEVYERPLPMDLGAALVRIYEETQAELD